jgi:hypothetical protein
MKLFTEAGQQVKLLSIAELTLKQGYPHKMVLRRQIKAGKVNVPGFLGIVRIANTDAIAVLAE